MAKSKSKLQNKPKPKSRLDQAYLEAQLSEWNQKLALGHSTIEQNLRDLKQNQLAVARMEGIVALLREQLDEVNPPLSSSSPPLNPSLNPNLDSDLNSNSDSDG